MNGKFLRQILDKFIKGSEVAAKFFLKGIGA
jgi:hypothetical protein